MTEYRAKPESSYCPHFTFKTFAADTNLGDEERVFALRYQVYCLERFFLPAENYPDGLEQDGYDAYSTHIAAYSLSGLLVGSLRLVTPPDGGRFPFLDHCIQLFADRIRPPDDEYVEISRLVISKLYRRRANDTVYGVSSQLLAEDSAAPQDIYDRLKEKRDDSERRKLQPEILLGLLRQVYVHCKLQGIPCAYMALEMSLVRLLQRLLFCSLEPIGEQADYFGPVTPCILSMEHFEEALSSGDPVLFAWFQNSLEEAMTYRR